MANYEIKSLKSFYYSNYNSGIVESVYAHIDSTILIFMNLTYIYIVSDKTKI